MKLINIIILNTLIAMSTYTQSKGKAGWENLTVREKICQVVVVIHDPALQAELGGGNLEVFFKKYPVSAFWTGWKNLTGTEFKDRIPKMIASIEEYRNLSPYPPLFMEDFEKGIGDRFQGMTALTDLLAMSAAAGDNYHLAYRFGETVATEARSIGVNMLAHPVADINLNPLNPIVSIRSTGDNPDRAIALLAQQVKAMQSNGVAATIKHFPGDGVGYRDQHMLTSCNSLSKEQWHQYHGKVFQALIDSGVYCIMPGHISLPCYQTPEKNGMYLPATLSKELLTDLLKGKMGFDGVILSDALLMGGFRGWYKSDLESELQAFIAGSDLMLWPSYEFIDTLEARILSGEIPMERLNDAVSRVWRLKEKLGLFDEDYQAFVPLNPEQIARNKETQKLVCDNSITLVKDISNSLPLQKERDKRILIVACVDSLTKGGDKGFKAIEDVSNMLKERGFNIDLKVNFLYENNGWKEDYSEKYDKILFIFAQGVHYPMGSIQLYDDQAQAVWGINAMPKEKVIVISMGNPYLVTDYFERSHAYINTHSFMYPVRESLARALAGEIEFNGVSPVDLKGKMKFMLVE